jgi:hydrogenase maturation protease
MTTSSDAAGRPAGEERTQAVVGVGSMVMGDDGVGYHAIEALEDRSLPDGTSLTHAGTTAFLALEAMSGADRALVVDALALDEPPGTIREFRLDRPEVDAPEVTMHDYSFTDALAVGDVAYDVPERVRLLGIVPAELDPALELSEPVSAALPELVSRIEQRLTEEAQD